MREQVINGTVKYLTKTNYFSNFIMPVNHIVIFLLLHCGLWPNRSIFFVGRGTCHRNGYCNWIPRSLYKRLPRFQCGQTRLIKDKWRWKRLIHFISVGCSKHPWKGAIEQLKSYWILHRQNLKILILVSFEEKYWSKNVGK